MSEHDDQERKELQARYERLTERIRAIDADLAQTLDKEREQVLRDRRDELATERQQIADALDGGGGAKSGLTRVMADSGNMDGRFINVETTLRAMDQKLDRMSDGLHDLDTRQRLLEAKVEMLAGSVRQLEASMHTLRSNGPDYTRTWLLATAVGIVVVLTLLIFITSRLV